MSDITISSETLAAVRQYITDAREQVKQASLASVPAEVEGLAEKAASVAELLVDAGMLSSTKQAARSQAYTENPLQALSDIELLVAAQREKSASVVGIGEPATVSSREVRETPDEAYERCLRGE